MNEQAVQPEVGSTTGLTQWQRVANTFSAPSKTFEDIKRGNRSWWMPYLIMVVIGYIFFAAITTKIGWVQVAQNAIHMDQKAEERLQQAPPDQRETTMKITRYSMQGGFAASPVLILIFVALASLVLWGTINFAFGGKAQFGGIFAVWMYASLPGVIKTLLGTVVVSGGWRCWPRAGPSRCRARPSTASAARPSRPCTSPRPGCSPASTTWPSPAASSR